MNKNINLHKNGWPWIDHTVQKVVEEEDDEKEGSQPLNKKKVCKDTCNLLCRIVLIILVFLIMVGLCDSAFRVYRFINNSHRIYTEKSFHARKLLDSQYCQEFKKADYCEEAYETSQIHVVQVLISDSWREILSNIPMLPWLFTNNRIVHYVEAFFLMYPQVFAILVSAMMLYFLKFCFILLKPLHGQIKHLYTVFKSNFNHNDTNILPQ